MRPLQNALAIVATFFVAGALLPWSARLRLTCAFAAIALIFVLLVLRLRSHLGAQQRRTSAASWNRIERIRADRDQRLGRR
jgi:hypothetical protein